MYHDQKAKTHRRGATSNISKKERGRTIENPNCFEVEKSIEKEEEEPVKTMDGGRKRPLPEIEDTYIFHRLTENSAFLESNLLNNVGSLIV